MVKKSNKSNSDTSTKSSQSSAASKSDQTSSKQRGRRTDEKNDKQLHAIQAGLQSVLGESATTSSSTTSKDGHNQTVSVTKSSSGDLALLSGTTSYDAQPVSSNVNISFPVQPSNVILKYTRNHPGGISDSSLFESWRIQVLPRFKKKILNFYKDFNPNYVVTLDEITNYYNLIFLLVHLKCAHETYIFLGKQENYFSPHMQVNNWFSQHKVPVRIGDKLIELLKLFPIPQELIFAITSQYEPFTFNVNNKPVYVINVPTLELIDPDPSIFGKHKEFCFLKHLGDGLKSRNEFQNSYNIVEGFVSDCQSKGYFQLFNQALSSSWTGNPDLSFTSWLNSSPECLFGLSYASFTYDSNNYFLQSRILNPVDNSFVLPFRENFKINIKLLLHVTFPIDFSDSRPTLDPRDEDLNQPSLFSIEGERNDIKFLGGYTTCRSNYLFSLNSIGRLNRFSDDDYATFGINLSNSGNDYHLRSNVYDSYYSFPLIGNYFKLGSEMSLFILGLYEK